MTISTGAGATLAIASTYGASKTMSVVTNANPAVATLEAGHGVAQGEYIHITSGWTGLNNRCVRVSAVNTNDVTLEGVDTSSTSQYPVGSGTGSVREVSVWTQIANVKADSFSTSGGDQQFTDATPLDSLDDVQLPTTRSATSVQFSVMDSSAGLTAAKAVGITPTAFRLTAGTVNTVGVAVWTVSEVPRISGRDVTQYPVSLSFQSVPKTYFS